MKTARFITIKGLVQGVGFRPFIFLLASKSGIHGWVRNTNEGVEIFAEAGKEAISTFIHHIRKKNPPASIIEELNSIPAIPLNIGSFTIMDSENRSDEITSISPDIAVCDDCLKDMEVHPRRRFYPFVNCTNCGPRFSIIRDLPYDRSKTSMDPFPMCEGCRTEYRDINDRRFHAQPVACIHCGPFYELIVLNQRWSGDTEKILTLLNDLLNAGKIIAVKGIGGFHLACDAFNVHAVRALRTRKKRDGKPFALMFRDIETLSAYAKVSRQERAVLTSWRRPIVILDMKQKAKKDHALSYINSGLGSIGAFLPYMPIHYLLFRYFNGPAIVLTSGNMSAEPIIKDDEEAIDRFQGLADAFLIYNREIVHRTDDSVVRIIGNKESIIRRSRGYTPAPVRLSVDVNNIIAFGADVSSGFCVGKGNKAFPGMYIGDLKNLATQTFFEEALEDFIRMFRVQPGLLACDLHPGYFSTRFAEKYALQPLVRIQHHHAHIASCMAEHGIDEKVIGVAFDGTGYGSDGKIWGGEFLLCDLADYKRLLHFEYIPLPGGDKAVEEPWRTAIAYLYRVFGRKFIDIPLPFLAHLDREQVLSILNMTDRKINCPEVSSAGRIFDAVAAIMNLCLWSTFQAEAPMRLESLICSSCEDLYSYKIDKTIIVDEMIREIVLDILNSTGIPLIATKFHNTIISIIFESVIRISKKEKIRKVVLSGGVFQNKYVVEKTTILLKKSGLLVFSHQQVPANDGGIALGQMIVAAKRRSMKCV
ncbi:MAG: carbamoyltransferase HypF [Bacteroidales bacterium]|jgi:hydrogenase maturation protein HypF|nr:carbamoyltransferase HypF [Bacteroidales bacterium]